MAEDFENLSTFLAYTKSPKITKRTSFQDELKKAVSARVSRQQAIQESDNLDYSDEFESDDSLDDSLKITKASKLKFRKSLHNFHFSDDDDDDDNSHSKMSFVKTKRQDKEPDYSATADSGNRGDRDLWKTSSSADVRSEHILTEDQNQKPTPKPRESRIKCSPSPPGFGISATDKTFKPTPQHRTKDKTPVSAASSLGRLNDTFSVSEAQQFTERHSPQELQSSNVSSPRLKSPSVSEVQKTLTVTKEETSMILKDLQIGGNSFDKMESGIIERDSRSALEMMLSEVKEKSVQQENKDPLSSETHKSYDSGEQDTAVHKKEELNKITLEKKMNQPLQITQSSRPLSAPQSKKSVKPNKPNSAKSRYLGTLTILDKSVYKKNGELEAADTLRATVYQNWLEKKKAFLDEIYKIKKDEEKSEREKLKLEESMKKEEAMAAFMAWKAEKKGKIYETQKKQKLEEKKKLEEIQDIALKKEECRRAFEKWKESKEGHLKQKALKEKHTEKEKMLKEQKAIMEKKSINVTAFKTWNERKEHVLKEKKYKLRNEKKNLEKLKAEKEERDKMALEMYEQWLEKKELQEKFEKRKNKTPPPPWSPPGRTIPAGR
ncbi:microtubule-associated protein 9 [Gastrophryne carolinensis]